MTASELSEEMLRGVRSEFYAGINAKTFFQERAELMKAITAPAAYLHKRGAMLPAASYRRILATVIDTIKAKGMNRAKIERFSVYFLHCVQTHMEHHGEKYYYAGKSFEGRSISPQHVKDVLGGALKNLSRQAADQTVPVLAEVHRTLTARGRVQRAKKTGTELDLFADCKPVANRAR